jgi:hypothetical protein
LKIVMDGAGPEGCGAMGAGSAPGATGIAGATGVTPPAVVSAGVPGEAATSPVMMMT